MMRGGFGVSIPLLPRGVLPDSVKLPTGPAPWSRHGAALRDTWLSALISALEWEAAALLAGPGSRAGQDSPGCPCCSGAGSGTGWSPPRCSHPRRGAQPCGAGMSCLPGTRRLGSAQPCGEKLQLCHGVPVGKSLAASGQCRVAEDGMKEAGGHADTFFCV